MDRLPNIHPGEVLLEELLKPMSISRSPKAKINLEPFFLRKAGQELNDEFSFAKANMLIKEQNMDNIVVGNTLSDDGHYWMKTFPLMGCWELSTLL